MEAFAFRNKMKESTVHPARKERPKSKLARICGVTEWSGDF